MSNMYQMTISTIKKNTQRMTCGRECLQGGESVVLLNGLSGKLTFSKKNMNKDLKEMKTPRRISGGSTPSREKSKCKRLKVGACLTHLRNSQDDSKGGQAVLLQHVFLIAAISS